MSEEIKISTMEQSWNDLAERTMSGLNPQQIFDLKKAFYAGAFSLIQIFCDQLAHIEDDDVAADALENLRTEIFGFFEGLGALAKS